MATTINSTNLDFNSIKNNLKTFLAQQDEFADYNFEASGLSNILDVLAYNTHYNGLIANFALNESYLGTAQLRSSIVSLAESIGYIPGSRTAAYATVRISVSLAGVSGRPTNISLNANTKFTSTIDDISYTFQTREALQATDDGTGLYRFATADGNYDIKIYEGTRRTKSFIADESSQNAIYVIPDENLDTSNVVVRVYETPNTLAYETYTDIRTASTVDSTSMLFILKESPNGFFELSFGDGNILGQSPVAGNKIEVDYISSNGPAGNGGKTFVPVSQISVGGNNYNLSCSTVVNSIGGDDKETVESIRKNAPFLYASQNRMVTPNDYSALVLRNFSTLIKDINTYGGEEALNPEYGAVYMSIVFEDDVTASTQTDVKAAIQDLVSQLAVVSFNLRFVDPTVTYLESNVFFQFNPKLTSSSLNTVTSNVNTAIATYFASSVGSFEQSFRRSNLLALIDNVSPAVLSSRMDVKMQQRVTPTLAANNDITLRYPAPIAAPDDEFYRVTTTPFVYNGKTCIIRNRLTSNKLQIVSLEDDSIVVDNIGEYASATGTLRLVGFRPSSIIGGVNFIKFSVVPANQSAISPTREDILVYDEDPSFASGVIVSST